MTDALVLDHDWYPATVPANVVLGNRSWLYSSYAFLHFRSERDPGIVVGEDSGVYVGTMFDIGATGRVEIGRWCTMAGPVISTDHSVVIGDYALVSWDVVIADTPFARSPADHDPPSCTGGDVLIGENCWIGARATVLGPATLGNGVIVGAAAVVTGEIPDFAVVAGNPATIVGWSRPSAPSS